MRPKIRCIVVYSVIRWTKKKYATTGEKVQGDNREKYSAYSISQAKRKATLWGDPIQFREANWVQQDHSKQFPRTFTKSIFEDDLELRLTLMLSYP